MAAVTPAEYVVTGLKYNTTKHFEAIHTNSVAYAMGINLWRGSVWKIINGKRVLIKRVYN